MCSKNRISLTCFVRTVLLTQRKGTKISLPSVRKVHLEFLKKTKIYPEWPSGRCDLAGLAGAGRGLGGSSILLMVLSSDTCARLSPVWSANEPQDWRSLGVGVNSCLGDGRLFALCHLPTVSQTQKHYKGRNALMGAGFTKTPSLPLT